MNVVIGFMGERTTHGVESCNNPDVDMEYHSTIPLSYEEQREKNIARNQQVLEELGLITPASCNTQTTKTKKQYIQA